MSALGYVALAVVLGPWLYGVRKLAQVMREQRDQDEARQRQRAARRQA